MIKDGISVIIPNFNGLGLLPQILPPLFIALKNSNKEYEVIVVDDYSTDDSVKYLHEHYSHITVLQNEVNKGFAPTVNKGIFYSKYAYLLILNSDVRLSPQYFIPLLKYFNEADTFGVTGRITGWDDNKIQDGGKYPYFHGAKIKTSGNYIPRSSAPNEKFYCMYLSGANAFISREKLMQLNGFDEIFAPYYVEDFELCLRAWRLSWKCYYEHEAICGHKVSVTIKSSASKRKVAAIYDRNKMFLHAIHLSGIDKMLWYFQLIFETFIRLITFRWYYLKALSMFSKSSKKISKSVENFKNISSEQGAKKSVKQVINEITRSLSGKQIERF